MCRALPSVPCQRCRELVRVGVWGVNGYEGKGALDEAEDAALEVNRTWHLA